MAKPSYDPNVLQQALTAAQRFGATPRETKALIEAGLVESGLQNLHHGDADSVGFLQQRPSQGWKGLTNVSAAATEFLKHARAVSRGGFKGSSGALAQAVQRSAYPGRYDQQSSQAQSLLGAVGARPGAVAASVGSGPAGADSSGLNAGVAALLAAGQQKPQIQSAGIAPPAFSAHPTLPQGAQLPQGGGGPQPSGPDVNGLLALVAGSQQAQQDQPAVSPDAPSQATGPAAGASFGKSHSPLLELIHKGDKPYAVKNGKAVDSSVYSDVWDEHANHVHVAAGPNTVVALGKLAQQMGLSVGENVYFTGKKPARGVHAGESYHYRQGTTKSGKAADEAIDVSGDPRKMNQFAAQVERLYGLGG